MLFLSTVANQQGDPVALAMVLILALIVAVMALRKHQSQKRPAPKQPAQAQAVRVVSKEAVVPPPQQPEAPGSAGHVKLHDVEPKTAAMLMAIVANKMGKPLNELRFISIKEVQS